jgi:RND superfamily putative drug exporter
VLIGLVAWVTRQPRRVLAIAGLLLVVGVVIGGPVAGAMTSDVSDPRAPDVVATARLAQASGIDATPDAVVLVRPGVPVTTGAGRAEVTGVAAVLRAVPGVGSVDVPAAGTAPPGSPDAGLVSFDGRSALVVAHYDASVAPDPVSKRIIAALGPRPGVLVGGDEIATLEISDRVTADLTRAELIAFPLLMLIGLWVFRGLVAALVPLGIGVLAIVVSLLGLRAVNSVDQLSSYVLNLLIGLGLGLSIDYSLFVISRYREEAATAGYNAVSLQRAVVRAGRTVGMSALTVAAAMAALLVFPQRFLYSMGVGGVLVTLLAALCSLTVLPAVLLLLGERINALAPRRWERTAGQQAADPTLSVWYRVAHLAMRVPALTLLAALLVVGLALSPARSVRFSNVDPTSLPVSAPAHQVTTLVADDFPGGHGSQLQVVLTAPAGASATAAQVRDRLVAMPGAASVTAPAYLGRSTWEIDVATRAGPYSGSSAHLVQAIERLGRSAPVLVTGDAAAFVDLEQSMLSRLPISLSIVGVMVLAIIFLLTGSVVLAVKTLLFNLLNVAAVLGILVWVFQRGHLEGLLQFHSIGTIDLTQPILVLVIAFGLSTDYGVFLLARIQEAHRLGAATGADDSEVIALGLARTGRIITSAAVLLFVALGAFTSSSILFIKEIGAGVAVSVVLDATVVRAFLVPAAMRLFGRANWWAPRPLAALTRRLHLDEPDGLDDTGIADVIAEIVGLLGQPGDRSGPSAVATGPAAPSLPAPVLVPAGAPEPFPAVAPAASASPDAAGSPGASASPDGSAAAWQRRPALVSTSSASEEEGHGA